MEKVMTVLEVLSIGLLWTVTALNLCSLILNIRQYKKYRASVNDYMKASDECYAAAAAFDQAKEKYLRYMQETAVAEEAAE